MRTHFLTTVLAAAIGLPLAIASSSAQAVTITGASTSTFSNLANCGGNNCDITSVAGNPQVQWGSTNPFFNLVNPSTLTAPASLAFSGNTAVSLTIGKLTWFNSATVQSQTDPNFNVNWNLSVTFTSPGGAIGDSETFNLNIANTLNPPGDVIGGLTLADLSNLSFSLPGVLVSNVRYVATDVSGPGSTSLSCTHGNCSWRNDEGNTAMLTIQADFTAVPEPATLALLGAGMVGLGMIRRRQSQPMA